MKLYFKIDSEEIYSISQTSKEICKNDYSEQVIHIIILHL